MKFFGHDVSDTGCEMLVKAGSRFADPANLGHAVSWRDGQIIEVTPLGFHTGKQVGYCCALLKFPNINYSDIGGRWEEDWKKMPAIPTLWDKINLTANADGKYPWELIEGTEFISVRKTRDWFIDFKGLENQKLITLGEREDVYNYDNKTILTIASTYNLEVLVKHEEVDSRLDPSKLLQHASITTGTHSIGSGLDYDTVTAFEAAIGAQLTGNLTGEHNTEETAIAAVVVFDTDTNAHLLKLTAQSGDEHNGGAYGNGARINYGTSNSISFDETNAGDLADIEISKLALECSGYGNYGIRLRDVGGGGSILVNRMLIAGDGSNTRRGIDVDYDCRTTTYVRNNIVYGIASGYDGIRAYSYSGTSIYIDNNSVIKCAGDGFDCRTEPTVTMRNNLAQGCGVDYNVVADTHSCNISEDATGPDAAYDNTDVHTNSVFKDYAADDYRLDSAGDATNLAIVDDGGDLSGTFTDDIEGQTRSTWYIGASEIVAVGGLSIPVAMHHYTKNIASGR